jgi:ATP-dependent RNA helicase RhlE
VIVFTRTKRGADKVARYLEACGIGAAAIHGDKSQSQREKALAAFKAGACRAMVATDIAARGIDVDGVTHVINYELPNVPEAYVHRIGRTARAGATGIAISLCSDDERSLLKDIQRATRQIIPTFDRRNDKVLAQATAVAEALSPEKSRQHDEAESRPNRDGAERQANRKRRPQGRPGGHPGAKSPVQGRKGSAGSGKPGRGNGDRASQGVTSGSWSPLDS